jgi:hypothetical protein
VVECGNARYQDVVDRYIAGEPVARDQLKRVWAETTIASGMWLAPMYEAVLADVRAVNLTRPPGLRVRVLLGDPPINWSVVRGPADEDMNDWRDARRKSFSAPEIDPNNLDAHFFSAMLFMALERFAESIAHIERASNVIRCRRR